MKMKKKEIKLRYGWEINPKTRIKGSKKAYKRERVDWEREIDEEVDF